jgi:phosphohistidine phosphatase
MKNLILIRHAKSSWENPELEDHERPLNKRGLEDAPFMANILSNYGVKVDKLFSSTALRAKTTAEIFANQLNVPSEKIEYTEELYNASRRDILNFLKRLDDDLTNVCLVGHNPGLTDLAHFLLYDFDYELPTCAVVSIDLEIDKWSELKIGTGTLRFFEFPKKYKKEY